ncbi:hypothetical protein BDV12DRAFT_209192 [Aspergillus spectabilis]
MKLFPLLVTLLPLFWLPPSHAIHIHNPIIPGWNPDPAILRVGNEYFLAVSSMEFYPGIPIYRSTDLQNWSLYSHALTRPSQLQLYGTPTSAGAWAPSLSFINGTFYLTTTVRWAYDPIAKVWPRAFWVSSSDLKNWSDPVWSDPWGIDSELFQDPETYRVYLNLMAPNNNIDRLWGISQCEVDLTTGRCVGEYRPIWNGTQPHTPTARPEGPKMLKHGKYYYLLIAEGGTDSLHRATIARSLSPTGPWESNPDNPLLYNGAWGFTNLTVQSTGHATLFDTPEGDWYAVFLARRNIDGSSPLGRETFLCPVAWKNGWPVFNNGDPILLDSIADPKPVPSPFVDGFDQASLGKSWYRLRTPYTETYTLARQDKSKSKSKFSGLNLHPNVFSISDRDTPAAIFRKQTSLNMTFSATLLPLQSGDLGPRQTVGISAYLSELQHQNIGFTGCASEDGLCVYTSWLNNGTGEYAQYPLPCRLSHKHALTLYIRATPHDYKLGYSYSLNKNHPADKNEDKVTWLTSFPSSYLARGSMKFAGVISQLGRENFLHVLQVQW